jgi:ABC-type branched-subunit amino acid transport system ATPase component
MSLRDEVDVSRINSKINWANQAHLTRRRAESLPYGWRRNAEIDHALACEAIAHSRDLLLRTEAA